MTRVIRPQTIVFPASCRPTLLDAAGDLVKDRWEGVANGDGDRADWLALFVDAAEMARQLGEQVDGEAGTITLTADLSNVSMLASFACQVVATSIKVEAESVEKHGIDLHGRLLRTVDDFKIYEDVHAQADDGRLDGDDELPDIVTLPLRAGRDA